MIKKKKCCEHDDVLNEVDGLDEIEYMQYGKEPITVKKLRDFLTRVQDKSAKFVKFVYKVSSNMKVVNVDKISIVENVKGNDNALVIYHKDDNSSDAVTYEAFLKMLNEALTKEGIDLDSLKVYDFHNNSFGQPAFWFDDGQARGAAPAGQNVAAEGHGQYMFITQSMGDTEMRGVTSVSREDELALKTCLVPLVKIAKSKRNPPALVQNCNERLEMRQELKTVAPALTAQQTAAIASQAAVAGAMAILKQLGIKIPDTQLQQAVDVVQDAGDAGVMEEGSYDIVDDDPLS